MPKASSARVHSCNRVAFDGCDGFWIFRGARSYWHARNGSYFQAFCISDVAIVAPFDYTALIWATALGSTVWGNVPVRWSMPRQPHDHRKRHLISSCQTTGWWSEWSPCPQICRLYSPIHLHQFEHNQRGLSTMMKICGCVWRRSGVSARNASARRLRSQCAWQWCTSTVRWRTESREGTRS